MALTNTNQYGRQDVAYARDIAALNGVVTGLLVQSFDISVEPEVNVTATGQENEVISRAVTKPDRFQQTMTASGLITDPTAFSALANITFRGKFWIVTKRSESDPSDNYQKGTIEFMNNFNVTS